MSNEGLHIKYTPKFRDLANFIKKMNMLIVESVIVVAPTTRNKNRIIQGRSPNMVKVIFHSIWNCSKRKEFAPSGSKFFPLREVQILKKDAIEGNHCLVQ